MTSRSIAFTASTECAEWLDVFLARHGGAAGTVHLHRGGALQIAAAVNIPEPVLRATAFIPSGKGMAGLALERREPVTTCNLKEDTTGAVKPGARAVDARAAVALPVYDGAGGIRAVVGIAFPDERAMGSDELRALVLSAADLPAPAL